MPAITLSANQLIEVSAYDVIRQGSTTFQPLPVQIDSEYNPFKVIPTGGQKSLDPLSSVSSGSPAHWESFIDDFQQRQGESALPESQPTEVAPTTMDPLFTVPASPSRPMPYSSNSVYTFQEHYLFTTMSNRLAVIRIECALLRTYHEQQIATFTLEPDQAQPLLFAEELSLPNDPYSTHHELVEGLQQVGFEIIPQAEASADPDKNVYLTISVPKPLHPIGIADLITKTLGEYLDQVDRDDMDTTLPLAGTLAQLFLSGEALRQTVELAHHTPHAQTTQPNQIISDLFLTSNSQFDPFGCSITASFIPDGIDKWF